MIMKIFFDLDGTLADFEGSGGINSMWKKGFFQNLEAYPNGREVAKRFMDNGNEVFILSLCINTKYCKSEKEEWISKNLPFIPKENIFLLPTGTSKAEYVKSIYGNLDKDFILYDDYKGNLVEWKNKGGTAIKCAKQYKPTRSYDQMILWNIVI